MKKSIAGCLAVFFLKIRCLPTRFLHLLCHGIRLDCAGLSWHQSIFMPRWRFV